MWDQNIPNGKTDATKMNSMGNLEHRTKAFHWLIDVFLEIVTLFLYVGVPPILGNYAEAVEKNNK